MRNVGLVICVSDPAPPPFKPAYRVGIHVRVDQGLREVRVCNVCPPAAAAKTTAAVKT